MRFTQQNSAHEFTRLNQCIQATQQRGEISPDDAESLTYFLELIQEALVAQSMTNS